MFDLVEENLPEFSAAEIEFMKNLGLEFDYSNLSDDEYIQIEDTVGFKLSSAVQDSPLVATKEIIMCENILAELE